MNKLILTASLLITATQGAAADDQVVRRCILEAASHLPTIPGIEIVDVDTSTSDNPNMLAGEKLYTITFTVRAAGVSASYRSFCSRDMMSYDTTWRATNPVFVSNSAS